MKNNNLLKDYLKSENVIDYMMGEIERTIT